MAAVVGVCIKENVLYHIIKCSRVVSDMSWT